MSQIYVYYKVGESHRAAAIEAAAQLLRHVETMTGVRGVLSCRADDPLTLMEAYPVSGDAESFKADLLAALCETPLPGLILGERHTEHFVTCA